MEFKEVIGRRRSIRFFEPDKPVEPEKIQTILEAARLASCAVNAHWAKAIVVERDKLPEDKLEKMKTPVAALNIELAPVHIYWYADLSVVNRVQGSRLKELVDVGALAPTHGWSHKFVDDFVYPQILKPMTQGPGYPVGAATDAGVAMCQALLTCFDEGLGACLSSFNPAIAKELFHVPDEWIPLYVLLVGYPAESWNAGGQRPRPPFEEQYHYGEYGTAYPRDPAVVEKLKQAKMIQEPAKPNDPARIDEIKKLAERLGLPM
jgi:nitroreductase